jgi:hypothetical protein
MYITRALIGRNPCLDQAIQTRKFKVKVFWTDLSPYNYNFDLDKSRQKFHHSLKEHHKISNIPKFRCEML